MNIKYEFSLSLLKRLTVTAKKIGTHLLIMCSLFLAGNVTAEPFSELVVFSGSLNDTGNWASFNGDFPEPHYNNRTTNGPAIIDIFAKTFNLSSEPSLHITGGNGGTNYATLHASAWGDLPIDLPAQLAAYLEPRNYQANPTALYFIFIGANDIVAAAIEQDEAASEKLLQNGIDEVEKAFRKLHAGGARYFYAPNNVNLGTAPIAMQYGISERVTGKTIEFNRKWELLLRKLERELKVTIYRFDFFRFIDDVFPIVDKLGITNATDSCAALEDEGLCDLEKFAFFDELLPTAKIHALMGNALATGLIEQISSPKCNYFHRCGRVGSSKSYTFVSDFWPAVDFLPKPKPHAKHKKMSPKKYEFKPFKKRDR